MIFLDTSAIIALFDRRSSQHARAQSILHNIQLKRERVVLTDYILDESITTARTRIDHRTAVMVGEFLQGSKVVELFWLDEPLKRRAWEYFKQHDDKTFSFTDCTSFVLMREMNVKRYFSFDDDFKRAGFVPFA